jgi:PAS domain S-box-containing protein
MTPINILIVDDREENIIALEALLARDDIRLISTTSPNDALKIAWDNTISIALVDVQMPEMDGFELVEMLKSNPRTKDIMVIFVTAISKESKYAVKGLGVGAIDYLYKPLDPYITSAKVDSFVQLARSRQEILQKNEELQNYAVVVKNSADIICSVDATTLRIKTINPAAAQILGYKPNEVIDKSIVDLAVDSDKDAFRKKLGEIIKDNRAFSVFEFQFNTFDKRTIWTECRASYRNKTIFLNISDSTPQKSYQQQLIRSKEAAEIGKKAKETFLANMSHELRTPVNGIIGLTSMLGKTDIDDQQKGLIEMMETSSRSLLGVINDVLDISKIDAGKFSIVRAPANIRDIAMAVYGLLKFNADEKNIEFILDVNDDVPETLLIDSLRLNQILMNLISNAIKFTDKGFVELKVSLTQRDKDNVKLSFSVRDSGIGIPQNRLNKIFESFEQADENTASRYGGTGLGLTIVKKLVELKGGDLNVISTEGAGSEFVFTNWFKVTATPVQQPEVRKDKVLAPFVDAKVLVAEDNMINQFMLGKMLKDWNVQYDMVDTGDKVLEKLAQENYDLILMDTHMPGMNGYQAARAIRMDMEEPKRSIPIISLSAAAFEKEHQEAVSAGMNDVLSKPFEPQHLHSKMLRLINAGAKAKKQV